MNDNNVNKAEVKEGTLDSTQHSRHTSRELFKCSSSGGQSHHSTRRWWKRMSLSHYDVFTKCSVAHLNCCVTTHVQRKQPHQRTNVRDRWILKTVSLFIRVLCVLSRFTYKHERK